MILVSCSMFLVVGTWLLMLFDFFFFPFFSPFLKLLKLLFDRFLRRGPSEKSWFGLLKGGPRALQDLPDQIGTLHCFWNPMEFELDPDHFFFFLGLIFGLSHFLGPQAIVFFCFRCNRLPPFLRLPIWFARLWRALGSGPTLLAWPPLLPFFLSTTDVLIGGKTFGGPNRSFFDSYLLAF